MEILRVEQGSKEWLLHRVGKVTASRCGDVIACTKKGESADRRNYRTELICERLTGQPYPHFVSQEMIWGRNNESFARAAYELQHDVLVETVGCIDHPKIQRFTCSVDGLVGTEGLIEIKAPATATHIAWMLGGVVPSEHMAQMLAEMACTGRAWADFVSFDCRLPAHLQLFVKRFQRDDKFIATLESEVQHFNYELDEVLAALPQQPQPIAALLEMPRRDELEF
jgi:putative phage-type endonuclease